MSIGSRVVKTIIALCAAFALCGAGAPTAWQPSAGHTQVPLWPATSPAGRAAADHESTLTAENLVGGKRWNYVVHVSRPTLTVYPPKGKNTGAAVVVFPGGGYQILAIDLEGTEICDWLNSIGITAVLLKYRVPHAAPNWDQFCGCDTTTRSSIALEDAQRTLSLVRAHAAEWHIDTHKLGVIGFSAGGHLVAAVSTRYDHRVYAPVDAADRESCRPDFAMAVYPGHLFSSDRSAPNPDIRVTPHTPPTLLVQAENDPVDPVRHSLTYYDELRNAGVPVEMHLYAEGGHAFGLRPSKFPITGWPRLAETWLRTIGMVPDGGTTR